MKKSDVVRKALENWRKGIYADLGICSCIMRTADWGDWRVIHDVRRSLTGVTYVNEWLNERGIYPTESELREYRELWLEHLLNYYLSVGE